MPTTFALQLLPEDRTVVLARLPSLSQLPDRSAGWAAAREASPGIVMAKTSWRISSSFSFNSLPSRSNSDPCMGRTMKPLSVGLPQSGQNAVVSENRRLQCRQCLLMCVLLNFPLLSATSLGCSPSLTCYPTSALLGHAASKKKDRRHISLFHHSNMAYFHNNITLVLCCLRVCTGVHQCSFALDCRRKFLVCRYSAKARSGTWIGTRFEASHRGK